MHEVPPAPWPYLPGVHAGVGNGVGNGVGYGVGLSVTTSMAPMVQVMSVMPFSTKAVLMSPVSGAGGECGQWCVHVQN